MLEYNFYNQKRWLRIQWFRLEQKVLKALANKLDPYMPQGVHVHGNFQIEGDGASLSGLHIDGNGGTAIAISQKR